MIPIVITTVAERADLFAETLASIEATAPNPDLHVTIGRRSPIENFCLALADRFELSNEPEGVIVCEDDILFCAGWYEALMAEANSPLKPDVLSAMSFGPSQPGCWSYASDGCPCCCLLIRRDWWQCWKPAPPTEPIGKSNWLRNGILETKGTIRILNPHYCQHVGLESTGTMDHRLTNRVSLSLAGPLVRGNSKLSKASGPRWTLE